MKTFKRIVIALAILIVIPLLIAVFTKKDIFIERSITINQPREIVFEYVKYFENMKNYGVWYTIDPNMTNEYFGEDGTVGFINSWSSTNKMVGNGEQEITGIVAGERIESELRMLDYGTKSEIVMLLSDIDSTSTKVVWQIKSQLPYPTNIMLLFTNFENAMGEDFEIGLNNLKEILENR